MIDFVKYHGAGNDFILIDDREEQFDTDNVSLIHQMCDRHFGIGADGLMLLRHHTDHDFEMIYFNSDGNWSSMCGNGGRCITSFAFDLGMIGSECAFMAVDGLHHARVLGEGGVALQMNDVTTIESLEDGAYFLDTGSPHYVIWRDDLESIDLINEARAVRYADRWAKEGVNVNFICPSNKGISIRTYERGVEDETLACGTGVTAAAIVAHHSRGLSSPMPVSAVGGALSVSFEVEQDKYVNVWKTGPTAKVFEGRFAP